MTTSKKRILVVDDNDAIREIVADALSLYGYEVRTASDGAEALAEAREAPSLVLLDLMMPGLDGASVAARLAEQGCSAPIVVATADRAGAERAKRMGAAGFLPKPFDLDRLLEVIARLLKD